MSKIRGMFDNLKEKGEKALITFNTFGYPTIDEYQKLLTIMAEEGVNLIEVGIPYSDPLADGPVIQMSSQKALENGVTMDTIFEGLEKFRESFNTPLVMMGYFNAIRAYGFERFVDRAKSVGVDGAIIPDLPLEEKKVLNDIFDNNGLDLITMVAPTSLSRVEALSKGTSGFIYCVSSLGVTGSEIKTNSGLTQMVDKIRETTDTPIAMGFGINDSKIIDANRDSFDGFIIGSEVIRQIKADSDGTYSSLRNFLQSIKSSCVKTM